jgi:hypothetical protein
VSAGGLPERRPDQRLIGTTRAGTGPAPQNQVFFGRLVIIYGTGASSGLFVYNGTPGLGNPPIFSITTASSDPYGNPTTASSITDSALPILIYSGPPAKGNLVIAIAPFGGGTDAYGNVYPAGSNFGVWNAAGALINHFGIGANGNIFLASAAGATVLFGQSSDGSLLFYDASGRVAGHLNIAIAPAAGNDGLGDTYVEGITVQNGGQIAIVGTGGAEIVQFISAGNPIMEWQSGYVNESQPAYIQVNLENIGLGTEYIAQFLRGPSVSGQADAVIIQLTSSQQGAAVAAFGSLIYQDTSAVIHTRLTWNNTNVEVTNSNSGDTNSYDVGAKTLVTTGPQTISSTGATIITGLSGTVGIGKYHITGQVTYKCNQTAAQSPTFLIGGQAQSQILAFSQYLNLVNSGASTSPIPFINNTGYPNNAGPTYVNAAFLQYSFDITVITTTSGGMSVEAATSLAADTFTIQAGSWMKIEPWF